MRTEYLTGALTGLCVVAITVLSAIGAPVPDVLVTVALVSVGAGAGAAVPRAGKATP